MARIFKVLYKTSVVQQFFDPYRITHKIEGLCKILCLMAIGCFLSCVDGRKHDEEKGSIEIDSERPIVVYGKVRNFDHDELDLQIGVNKLGTGALQLYDRLNEDGSFSISFESYVPTDVWIKYKTN